MIYFGEWGPYIPADNPMFAVGGAAIAFGIWNITNENVKGGIFQIGLGLAVLVGSFLVR